MLKIINGYSCGFFLIFFFLSIKNLKQLQKNIIKKNIIKGILKILFEDNSNSANLTVSKKLLKDTDVSLLKKKISINTFGNRPKIGKLNNKKKQKTN